MDTTTQETVNKVRDYFKENYGHIHFQEIPDDFITGFLKRDYVKLMTFERQMDFLQDHIMSQGLASYDE